MIWYLSNLKNDLTLSNACVEEDTVEEAFQRVKEDTVEEETFKCFKEDMVEEKETFQRVKDTVVVEEESCRYK